MDALEEARNSLSSFQSQFNDEGKVYALDAIASALIAVAEELRLIRGQLNPISAAADLQARELAGTGVMEEDLLF